LILLFFPSPCLAVPCLAATIYVDPTLATDCTSGTYSIENRDCTGTDGDAYDSIQEAITNCVVGDVIYMRGGTYSEINIDPPESKNGTAWTPGNFTTLASYPGEWAIVDGTGLNTGADWTDQAVFSHPTGYGPGEDRHYTEYWLFERFEVTGGRSGFFLKMRNVKFRYLFIHDNGRDGGDTLIGGILSVCPMYVTVEYCYFKDNIQPHSDMNNSNILFDSDYHDGIGNGHPFDPNAATHHNIVRYNYMTGSRIALRQKNQPRFGLNDRDPHMMTYKGYGDQWHHNVILNATESIGASQDFIQIYNNIADATINFGRRSGSTGDVPQIYNGVVYNNTVKRGNIDASYGSYTTSAGWSETHDNFYDKGEQRTVHEHVWFLNNIADNNPCSYQDEPFSFHWNIPANTSNPDQDMLDMVVDRNLIHENRNGHDFVVGHNFDLMYVGCDNQYIAASDFDSCSAGWRGVMDVVSYDNDAAGLYQGVAGAEQYITDGAFGVGGGRTIGDGGTGGVHPYLDGLVLPGYIGATDPADIVVNNWVEGVMTDLTSTSWLRGSEDRDENDDPIWIAGSPGAADAGVMRGRAGDLEARPQPYAGGWLRISYSVSGGGGHGGPMQVGVYEVSGREVRVLELRERETGYHHARWDGTDAAGVMVPSGVYFVRLEAGDRSEQVHLVVLR